MQTISTRNKLVYGLTAFFTSIATPCLAATDFTLSSSRGTSITFNIKNNYASARDIKKKVTYYIDPRILKSLVQAVAVKQIENKKYAKEETSILLTRELSKPRAMGKGYCGAGFEDYLLLTQITAKKIVLLDKINLQSCLDGISIFTDNGDDNLGAGLTLKTDGSIRYRLVDDDYDTERILTIKDRRFNIKEASNDNPMNQ